MRSTARLESTIAGSSDVEAATLPSTGCGLCTRRGAGGRGRTSRAAREPCLRRSRRRASFGEWGRSDKNVSWKGRDSTRVFRRTHPRVLNSYVFVCVRFVSSDGDWSWEELDSEYSM